MDLMIQDGDYILDHTGQPVAVFGEEEAAQRAAMIFSTIKGFFPYDREFGLDLYSLSPDSSREQVMLVCNEALKGREDFMLTDAYIEKRENEYYLCFEIEWRLRRIRKEIKL